MPESGDTDYLDGVNKTTQRLLDAAAAEFAEHGYDGAVISRIARRAGVTTGAVFSRWPTKEDVMIAAVEHTFELMQPKQRLVDLGIVDQPPPTILMNWGAHLLSFDFAQSALTQTFGSAQAHPSIQVRLQEFLERHADQVSTLVERAKNEGMCDPELSTTALSLLIQAIGVGTEMLLSAGRSERLIPSEQEWVDVLVTMIAAAAPAAAAASDGDGDGDD
ncbi:MAG: TetR/AcrR family transcriptional regulator [Acidimicrobiaceae bacterium]|nr:TetR/AcrR family transcriptional regulator [Acidimicrobiaceae bacterium]